MTTRSGHAKPFPWRACLAAATALVIAACGGGGSSGGGVAATPLPVPLTVTAPNGQQALDSAVSLSANAVGVFSYRWEFGDGTSSTLAAPSHRYARAGVYTITLTLANGDGASAVATTTVSIADFAVVAGKLCSQAGGAGWCWQEPLPQGNFIRDYHWVSHSLGFAVGDHGTVLVSRDGGATWSGQRSGTELDLGHVFFVDALTGWASGSNGEVLRTLDGGATWQRLSIGRNDTLQSIGARDATAAWLGTLDGGYVTSDGGTTWRQVRPQAGFARVVFVSETDLWALPAAASGSHVAQHSTDGATTWADVALPPVPDGLTAVNIELQFADATHALLSRNEQGFAGGGTTYVNADTLWLTADRGASWQPISTPPVGPSFGRYRLADATTVFTLQIGFPMFRTSDAGATWVAIDLPAIPSFFIEPPIKTFGRDRLLLFDAAGLAYLSLDGGATWALPNAGGAGTLDWNSVWLFDSREGVAYSTNGGAARTVDGGQTWTVTDNANPSGWRRAQFLADGSFGWIVSGNGVIYRSTDHGRTWFAPLPQPELSLAFVEDFHFVDAQRGVAVVPFSVGGQSDLYTSADGGLSWQRQAAANLAAGVVAVRMADASNAVAVGPVGIAYTSADAGATWAPRPTGVARALRRVAFADAATAVAVGDQGTIVRSTDRGVSWQEVTSPTASNLLDVRFVSSRIGHASGDAGTVLVTRDAGATWERASAATRLALHAVFFVDEMTGWVVGSSGAILATAAGGR